ncbi:MAG: hypothetical protein IH945_04460 [Armatimonadetes bacterium]|nr:hypothetical protein [Armatimonadota bacterium]
MKIKQYSALAALLLLVAGCGNGESEPKESSSSNGSSTAPAEVSAVPENLKNAAYEYYGLGEEATLTYIVKMNDDVPARDCPQTVTFVEMEDGSAKFRVTRVGWPSGIGSETLLLNDEGVFTKALNFGVLDSPALQVPADLALGSEWEAPMRVVNGSQIFSTIFKSRAVREEKTTVEAGTFDCLVIEADMTSTITGSPNPSKDGIATSKIVAYYAKGVGTIKMTMEGSQADGSALKAYIELKSIGEAQ